MLQFTKTELENILALIGRATINGSQAGVVAALQAKLSVMIVEAGEVPPRPIEPPP